ncbi:DinB family protein [Nocardiopsis sp. HNM0947]|uniref:DinB family protein n=1 Tax=Nocardiopsis coralli TaxID=2772213 RepID=A0ABR9P0F3_9ACTN|nr:DinB family protein [Nocardiopsis coralli]MBE2997326.1 DinB family protein [Nocardiopsis coralli]
MDDHHTPLTVPPTPRADPPTAADERTMLTSWLDRHRATVRTKCAGLDPRLAPVAPLATSPLMSVAGVVAHLRRVEHFWFEAVMLGVPDRGPSTPEDPDADWRSGAGVALADLLEAYERQCLRSREITARLELGSSSRTEDPHGRRTTLRWVLVHMLEETARHNGHLDLLRESADGTTGT